MTMLWQYVQMGGFLMIPLLIFSAVALGLVLERFYYFRLIRADVTSWFNRLVPETPPPFSDLKRHPLGTVLSTLWRERKLPPSDREALAKETAEEQLQALEKNLKPLGVIAILSPLLGLLGTVWGIMQAFQQTAGASHVEPSLLAGGIWQALITTFVGLAIAIPSWLAYYYFESHISRLVFQMEFFSSRFLRWMDGLVRIKP